MNERIPCCQDHVDVIVHGRVLVQILDLLEFPKIHEHLVSHEQHARWCNLQTDQGHTGHTGVAPVGTCQWLKDLSSLRRHREEFAPFRFSTDGQG